MVVVWRHHLIPDVWVNSGFLPRIKWRKVALQWSQMIYVWRALIQQALPRQGNVEPCPGKQEAT
ncbi:hypothetical protein GCM10025791_00110 [Halioxenophilus aromaticivorans]|uniref:Uncharacterized protein n=1 Tax=Halioxenophilus aromaticivorans TaxID=1306992 RepID=A0AAV3TVU0_9ALTE